VTTPEPRPGQGKVADRIAATLGAYGCRHAVGIPGNDVLETIRACEDHGIRFTLAKSEPSAAFMADAIYQITGAPVALIPALGPGIANAASGIAGALMERSALIVLTGGIAAAQDGLYTHQMFDHIALAAPITKHTAALNGTRPAQHVAKALDIALAYPAGPVMLNVPADLARATATETANFVPPVRASAQLDRDIAITLAARLSQAQRPVALIGRGALAPGVPEALTVLVEAYALPFFATYKAKGVVSERHPLSLGAVGLSPVVDGENMKRLREADLLLLVGFDPIELRDAWLDAWDPSVEIISIDWGPLPHRVFPVGTECLGDMPAILGQLLPAEPREPASTRHRTAGHWASGHRAAIAEIVKPRSPARGISPAALFAAVNRRLEQDWLLTVDVGAHRILANHVIECTAPGQLLCGAGRHRRAHRLPGAAGHRTGRRWLPADEHRRSGARRRARPAHHHRCVERRRAQPDQAEAAQDAAGAAGRGFPVAALRSDRPRLRCERDPGRQPGRFRGGFRRRPGRQPPDRHRCPGQSRRIYGADVSGPGVSYDYDLLETRVGDLLVEAGAAANDAAIVAGGLVLAEADGQTGHGLSRVASYAAQLRARKIKGHPARAIHSVRSATICVDADCGFALPAIREGLEAGLKLLPGHGIVGVAIANSHHSGVAGHSVELAARRGAVALSFANTPAAIAPWGGAKPLFGTNPVAIAAPSAGASPVVVDLSLSKVARGKIMVAAQKGEPIPPGWAVDADGKPTTDADAALAGSLLPMGDAKGAALALAVEILATCFTGANFGFEASSFLDAEGAPPRTGQFFVLIDPSAFGHADFGARVEHLLTAILRQPGTRIPGADRFARRARALTDGIPVALPMAKSLGLETE
jgi:LDH2 family malate/lactate/ureidoglycolate dehydrogenase/thiamine pyrophosphate-dependent acetolactate synthase large subunit-like protein